MQKVMHNKQEGVSAGCQWFLHEGQLICQGHQVYHEMSEFSFNKKPRVLTSPLLVPKTDHSFKQHPV